MNIEDREELFRLNDDSDGAVAVRLKAAREVAGFAKQKDFAAALNLNSKTYHAQESTGRVQLSTVRFLHRNHGIDYNFIYNGDFLQLRGDVQLALEAALSDANSS